MADSFTDLLRIRQQENGGNSTTWGTLANASFNMLEEAIAGRAAVTHDNTANYTLTTANDTTDESRNAILNIAGALTAARNTVCPTSSKVYIAKNATTGGYATTLKTTAGTGISIPNGKTMLLFCDGTNVVEAIDYVTTLQVGTLTLTNPIGPASGGTGIANNAASTITITGAYSLGLTLSNTTALTLPTTGTLATLAGTEELDNKTLDSSVGKGTWTASGTWTLPSLTLSGTVSGTPTWASTQAMTISGSAATLTTPRAINGVNFDGSAAITVTAAAGTLSGATLAAGVTASSLTSVGTLTSGATGSGFGALVGTSLSTGSGSISGGAISGTTLTSSTRIDADGGMRVTGTLGTPGTGGAAVEMLISGGAALIQGYNRSTAASVSLQLGRSDVATKINGQIVFLVTASPTGAGTGEAGQIAWDTSYFYICTATNDWRRIALVDF